MKIGIIGLGHWGKNYLRVFNELDVFEEIILCDSDESLVSIYSKNKLFSNAQAIFDDRSIESIVIATSPKTHFELLTKAINTNKNILIEKPVVVSTLQSKKILKRQYEGLILAGHTFLYNNAVRYMKNFLQKEDIGEIYYVNCKRVHLGLIRDDVNVLWDLAPHDISILNFLFGDNMEVLSANGVCHLREGRYDMVCAILKYSNIIVGLYFSWIDTNKTRSVEIIGSKAKIVFDDINMQSPITIYKRGVERARNDTFGDYQYLFRSGDIISPFVEQKEPLKNMCEHFVKCIKGDEQPTPLERSLKVVENIEKIQEALDVSGKQRIDAGKSRESCDVD